MKAFKRIVYLVCASVILFASCSKNKDCNQNNHCNHSFNPQTWDSCNYVSFKVGNLPIHIIDYKELPYVENLTAVRENVHCDVNFVPLHLYEGRVNYHPVYIAQYALQMLDVYVTTQDTLYLNRLEKITDKLLGTALEVDSVIFFPYSFDFSLHSCQEETMLAPWYSGMAQGQILSLFSRLYEFTGEKHYLETSRKIFNSFTRLKGEGHNPWVSCVDKNGNLWLEEYPRELPCFTLNGKIFAIYGIYDYYRIIKDEYAEKFLKAAIYTIRVNIHKYRNENDVSWYCLKHHNFHGQNMGYHKIHIQQLRVLHKITEDIYFKEMADKFESDTMKDKDK